MGLARWGALFSSTPVVDRTCAIASPSIDVSRSIAARSSDLLVDLWVFVRDAFGIGVAAWLDLYIVVVVRFASRFIVACTQVSI